MNIRILLADKHQPIRDSLRSLIENQPGMEVVGEAENTCSALNCVFRYKPDIVVMDINMSDLKGTKAVRRMISRRPRLKFVALSVYPNREFVGEMLKAGASGYLLKDCAFEELIPAIRCAINNQTYLGTGIEKATARKSETPSLKTNFTRTEGSQDPLPSR